MPGFERNLLKYWGEEYKHDERYILYFSDYNVKRKLGFDCCWDFGVFPVKLPRNFLKDNPLPQLGNPNKIIDIDGRIYLRNPEFNMPWYYENYISMEEMADYS